MWQTNLHGFGVGGVGERIVIGYEGGGGAGNGTADGSLGDAHVQKLSAVAK